MKSSAGANRPEPETSLPSAVAQCRRDEALMADLAAIYEQADRAVAEMEDVCLGGGACCKFDLADHRLYLSTAELAWLTTQPPEDISAASRRRCPYQKGPMCLAHNRRPLGCRTFFCRPRHRTRLHRLHESFHGQIRGLHQRRCIPYAYADVCDAIPQLFASK